VIDELVVTDTIPLSPEVQDLPNIRQVSVSSMVAETIRRINNEESISAMFDSYI
jgi:ribose-phosphate pyrophosphokinase